jgi:acyl-coenzyme A thioesterase PaaI-like protein
VLANAAHVGADGRGRFHAPRVLQSWPGIVHGGVLAALLDVAGGQLGAPRGPRLIEARLTASIPLETTLDLDGRAGEVTSVALVQEGQTLGSGTISAGAAAAAALTGGGEADRGALWRGGAAGSALPMSDDCLACGAANPLGLQVRLSFDDEGVWARWTPREPWRAGDGGALGGGEDALDDALAPVLLDEVAWWLGALTMREGGLTNRLAVRFHRPMLPWRAEGLIAAGRFADVTAIDRKRTFWRTRGALLTAEGEPLATATIVFRGGPDYSARQMPYFQPRTDPAVFRRMFPNHAEQE